MTSSINPNNIDGGYPIAGQDNNSQGFRDNFTNTKTNFEFAANEITDLQNKAILKAALTGQALNNNMNGSILSNAQLQDMGYTRVSIGTVSGSQTINYASGPYQTLTTSGSVNLSFTNWPNSGIQGVCRVQVTVANVAHTVTFTANSGWQNAIGIAGAVVSGTTVVITFATTGVYEFEFETVDGGGTITINEINKKLQPFNNSSEDLAASAAASLATGVNGQIKTFAMFADSGDMVITVTNAGWKSSGTGTITFDTIGDSCILQYINAKWFCIGNNGCVFA